MPSRSPCCPTGDPSWSSTSVTRSNGSSQGTCVTPKRLALIARFQHALRMLERHDSPRRGADTAAACGYADQSHFIRDFRRLAGCSPGEHLLTQGELTGFFIERA